MIGTAVWFTGPEEVELREEEVPAPGPGRVSVRSVCALISTGSELNFYRGEGNLGDRYFGEGTLPFPVKFGYQQIGHVEACGPGVALAEGDLVFCRYPRQDVFTVDAGHAQFVPAGVPPHTAAFMGLFRAAHNSLASVPPVVGDCVAVSGLGVVGAFAAHMSRLNASRLILIDPNPNRRSQSCAIGADAVVDPGGAQEAIAELTGGRGVDVFIETSGAPPALQSAIENTAQEGSITVASWYGSRPVSLLLSPEFHMRRQKIYSTGPLWPPALEPRWDRPRLLAHACERLERLDLESFVSYVRMPFSDAAEAYRTLNDPQCVPRAIVLDY